MSRRDLPLGFALLAFAALSGCKDTRESITGPGSLAFGSDQIFGSTAITAQVLDFQNRMVQRCLEILEDPGLTPPVFESSCGGGGGQATIALDDPINAPESFRISFTTYRIDCLTDVPMTVAGVMFIEFLERSPGLRYRITMPFNLDTADPEGAVYTLPPELGNTILAVTTPGQIIFSNNVPIGVEQPWIECALDAGTGRVTQFGTIRVEARSDRFMIVHNLQVGHDYNGAPGTLVRFGRWPDGVTELAAHNNGISDPPIDISFDGNGGASFQYLGRTCNTLIRDFDPRDPISGNPCTESQ